MEFVLPIAAWCASRRCHKSALSRFLLFLSRRCRYCTRGPQSSIVTRE